MEISEKNNFFLNKISYSPNTIISRCSKVFIGFIFSFVLLSACSSKPIYFKFTFTDELNPKGLLPVYYEINSNGKLVVLTDKFNENNELYNRTYFIELSKTQLDTALALIESINNKPELFADSLTKYIYRHDKFTGAGRESTLKLAQINSHELTALEEFCLKLLATNKRYDLNHSYYFNTDEFCFSKLME